MQSEHIHRPDQQPSAGTLAAEKHLCDQHDVAAIKHGAKKLKNE